MRPVIYTYNERNGSSRKIAEALGCPRVFREGSDYKYRAGDLIINWGCGYIPAWWTSAAERNCLNHPHAIETSVDKRRMFTALMRGGCHAPDFTLDKTEAQEWAQASAVYCRTEVEGKDGAGIVIARSPKDVVSARLYTRHVETQREYRVHVFRGRVIFATQKMQQANESGFGQMVRAGSDWYMGWVELSAVPHAVIAEARAAQAAIGGLDFAGVDVGHNTKTGEAVVFETNTAPGSFGKHTLAAYVRAIQEACRE
jgi:glutathione synthase/RimK-type ligase-like ATP-grasp enzyme